jgi:hypothetical protein
MTFNSYQQRFNPYNVQGASLMDGLYGNQDEKEFSLEDQHKDRYKDEILAPSLCMNQPCRCVFCAP